MSKVFLRKPSKGAPKPFKGRFDGPPQVKSREDHPDVSEKGPITVQRRRPKLI